jgi:hypothetical protein
MRPLHSAGNGETKNRLGGIDAVPASERKAQLRADVSTALHNPIRDLGCQLIDWPSQNRNCELRGAAHRVDVRDGISGGDTTKVIGVVDDWHEKVGRGEYRSIIIEYDSRRIVSRLMAYQ